jgi:hypothetical protein
MYIFSMVAFHYIFFQIYLFIFLCIKDHARFLNFYGQPEARLNRDQSVHGTRTNQRTWFIKTISIFLFSAPDVHLKLLQKMWVDGMMHKAVWEASLKKVNEEWREFTLYVSSDIQLRHACTHHRDIF